MVTQAVMLLKIVVAIKVVMLIAIVIQGDGVGAVRVGVGVTN